MTSGYVSTMSGIYMFDKDGHLRTNGWIVKTEPGIMQERPEDCIPAKER